MVDDRLNLDVHAINELQKKGFPPTNDSFKYQYTSDDKGDYSECCLYFELCIGMGVLLINVVSFG